MNVIQGEVQGRYYPRWNLQGCFTWKGHPFFRLEVFKREGILKVEAQKIVGKSASWLLKRGFKIFRRKVTCEGVTVDTFNHLSPNNDQHRFSPNNINTWLKETYLMITYSFKENALVCEQTLIVFEGKAWSSVSRICMNCRWGLKG